MAQCLCSVLIKRAESTIIYRKIIKCEWFNTQGEIVECVDRNISHKVVEKVINYLIKREINKRNFLFFFQTYLPTLTFCLVCP